MRPFTALACVSCFGILTLISAQSRADLPPPDDYVETCTLEKQQQAGETCKGCKADYSDPTACTKEFSSDYTYRCKDWGASVWMEIWCRKGVDEGSGGAGGESGASNGSGGFVFANGGAVSLAGGSSNGGTPAEGGMSNPDNTLGGAYTAGGAVAKGGAAANGGSTSAAGKSGDGGSDGGGCSLAGASGPFRPLAGLAALLAGFALLARRRSQS